MMPFAGRLIDKLGTRLGYMLAVTVWSLAAMAHSLSRAMRCNSESLGSRWASANPRTFRPRLKRWPTGFPGGSALWPPAFSIPDRTSAAMVAPLAVPYLAVHYGWRSAFICTGAIGFVWVLLWLLFYHEPEEHPHLSPEELALIQAGNEPAGRRRSASLIRSLAHQPPCVGFLSGKVPDGPRLVVLPFLAARILESSVFHRSVQPGPAPGRGLSGLDDRFHRRWLDHPPSLIKRGMDA